MNASDPLAGLREELNSGALTSLMWPVTVYSECPVKQGESFKLRSCRIAITSTQKIRRAGISYWLALFDRHGPERMYLLGKSGGYVEDSKAAMTAQADLNAGSQEEAWRGNPANLGPPPEPEAVPPHIVDQLPSTKASQMRHKKQKDEESQEDRERKDAERALRDQIRHAFRDIPAASYAEAASRISGSVREIGSSLKG